jgi:hypothetical protein
MWRLKKQYFSRYEFTIPIKNTLQWGSIGLDPNSDSNPLEIGNQAAVELF